MSNKIEKAALYLEEKSLMPKTKSSVYFEELYNHPSFCWRVPPFPLMGNDLENLLRLPIIKETERNLKVLDDVSGSIVARLLKEFPSRKITGVTNDKQKSDESNESLKMLNLPPSIEKGDILTTTYYENDILITATNITEQERLIRYLQEENFTGDLLAYRYNPPGPKADKVYSRGTYSWYHYSFSDNSPIVELENSRLNLVIGTKRYCQVHSILHCNKSTEKLKVKVSPELIDHVEVKLGKDNARSGEKVSMELSFKAYDYHSRNVTAGHVEFSDENDMHKCKLEIIIASIPMVEPALARWGDATELPTRTLTQFFEEETFHVIANWASSGMNPPYDYH
jgi:hypothetical protein